MITCKAAVALEAKKELVVQEVTVGPPQAGEVRVKVLYTGVCHTDEYTRSGLDPEGIFPSILGHEGAGIVESIGEGVTSVEVGDHVIPLYIPQCRDCEFCNSPKSNLCSKIRSSQGKGVMPDGTPRFKDKDGNDLFHFMGTSTFCQYTVLPEISLAKIDKDAPMDKVCLLGCGITTGYGAIRNTLKVEEGSTVVIIGLGGVGLAAIMGAAKNKAGKIIAVDINPDKFERASKFGATDTLNPKEHKGKEVSELIFDMTDGVGADYCIECVGTPHAMRQAFLSTKPNGGCSCIIGVAAAGQTIDLKSEEVLGREWTGSAFGGTKSRDEVPELVEDYLKGEIMVDEFVTHNFSLNDINEAFHAMHEGKCIRAVVNMFD